MDFLVNWITNVPGFAVPFALAALGLIITEKSGVLSLGAEGFMLVGALAGVGAVIVTLGGHPLVARGRGAGGGSRARCSSRGLVVALRVNQVIAGLAMVFFCQGLTSLIASPSRAGPAAPSSASPAADLRPLADIPVDRPHPVPARTSSSISRSRSSSPRAWCSATARCSA